MRASLKLRSILGLLLLASVPAEATTTDATPELRNSPKLVTPERVKTDPFSGTAAYAYKIDVPPGTAGMAPQLVLTYSTQTQHSEYGYGWSLNLPYIERSTREHQPYYNDPASASPLDDEFELAGDLLVRDGSTNRFYLRYADGSRILWDATNSRWEVTKPDGTRQLFGSTQYSRIFRNGDTPAETFRWCLSEVVDARGNSWRVFYRGDPDVAGVGSSVQVPYDTYVYPLEITYTHSLSGAAPLQDHRKIVFEWDERAYLGESEAPTFYGVCDGKEDCPTSYRAGFKVQRRFRLSRIAVGIDAGSDGLDPSEEVRSYTFHYTSKSSNENPENPPFSQLASIQRYGEDGVPFPSATEFSYTRPQRGFKNDTGGNGGEWASTPGMIVSGQTLLSSQWWQNKNIADMNGDGVMDRIVVAGDPDATPPIEPHEWLVYLGRIVQGPEGPEPAGFDLANPIHWTFDCGTPPTPSAMCAAARSEHIQHELGWVHQVTDLVDMDGDLRPDRVVAGTQSFDVYRNTGTGFGPKEVWPAPVGTDSGSGYTTFIVQSFQMAAGPAPWAYRFPADINGDGRPEYFNNLKVLVNTGAGFGELKFASVDGDGYFNIYQTGLGEPGHLNQLIDVNGDGLADHIPNRVCFTAADWVYFGLGFGAGNAKWQRYSAPAVYGGHEYAPLTSSCPDYPTPWAQYPESEDGSETFASMIDLNGDGIRDWVYTPSQNRIDWVVYFGLGDGRFLTTAASGGPFVPSGADGIKWDLSDVPACDVWGHVVARGRAGGATGRTIDLDGDGLVDYVRTNIEGPPNGGNGDLGNCWPVALPGNWSVWRHPGPEGLLETVTNELGGVTTIAYEPSTWLTSLEEEPEAGLPTDDVLRDGRPRWVVTHVEVSDGRSGTAHESESLDYAGFRFDKARHESFGVRMAENEDAAGLVTRSLFHQHPEKRGKLERQEKCDGTACFERSETEWSVIDEPVPSKSFLVRPMKTTTWLCDASNPDECDGSANSQRRVVERVFDEETGLLERETDSGPDGNIFASGDNLVRTLSYAKNMTEWIVSSVFEESLYFGSEGASNLASRTRLYYDAAAAGGGTPTTPQRCTSGGGLCGALVTFRETLRDRSPSDIWATEKWTYDDFGNLRTYFEPKLAAGSVATQTVVYDEQYKTFPISITNALGHTSQFHFDAALGEVEKAMTPGGYLRCFDYDEFGRLASRSETPGNFPPASFETASCNSTLATFAYPPERLGDPESQRIEERLYPGPSAPPIENLRYFDGLGREYQNETRHRYTPPTFDVVSRAWGTRGEHTCETLPFRRTGNVEDSSLTSCVSQTPRRETSYDAMLRPTEIERVEPGGGRVTELLSAYAVNGFSLSSSVGDLLVEQRTTVGGSSPNRVQFFGLDNRGQVAVLRDGSNPAATTTLVRDPKGRITRADGPDVAITSGGVDQNLLEIAYNAVDQRKELSQPISPGQTAAPKWRFSYDLNGDLYEQTSPRGETIRFHQDALRRLALKDYGPSYSSSAASPGPGDIVHEYADDVPGPALGLLEAIYGRHGIRTDFAYDYRGRVEMKTRDYWGSMQFTFAYEYDWLDRPIVTYLPDGTLLTQSYDGSQLSLVASLIPQPGGGSATDVFAYNIETHPSGGLANLWILPLSLGQGAIASSYDYGLGDHRLASAITTRDPSGETLVIQDLQYSHDTAGNLHLSHDLLGELDQQFTYDALHRLAEVATLGSRSYGTHRYQYDLAGNLLFKGPAAAPNDMRLAYDRTPGQPTHISAVDQRAQNGSWVTNVATYSADADGGITSRTQLGFFTTSFARDPDGRVYVVGLPASNGAVYHYDPSGERSEKVEFGFFGSIDADRYYVDLSFEVDTVHNTHEVHFFVGGRRIATSKRTGLGHNGVPGSVTSVTTYHPDQVGTNTVTTTSTASGQTVSKTFLDPFGQKMSGTGTEPRHLFTDQERDAETGLDYFGARFYDPWVGRFLEEDPSLLGSDDGLAFSRIAGDAGNLNGYSYVLNRPTRRVDPTGRDWIDWQGGDTIITFGSGGGSVSGGSNGSAGGDAGTAAASVAYAATGSTSSATTGEDPPPGVEVITVVAERSGSGDAMMACAVCAIPFVAELVQATVTTAVALFSAYVMETVYDFINEQSGDDEDTGDTGEDAGEPASERTAKDIATQIERDLGPDARREFHDMKEGSDRTLEQLKSDAQELYNAAGKEIPRWLR